MSKSILPPAVDGAVRPHAAGVVLTRADGGELPLRRHSLAVHISNHAKASGGAALAGGRILRWARVFAGRGASRYFLPSASHEQGRKCQRATMVMMLELRSVGVWVRIILFLLRGVDVREGCSAGCTRLKCRLQARGVETLRFTGGDAPLPLRGV